MKLDVVETAVVKVLTRTSLDILARVINRTDNGRALPANVREAVFSAIDALELVQRELK